MLPGKIFLQGIRAQNEQNITTKSTFKLNLILNNIYYDELKQFHTKYLCVNSTDVLTIELVPIESSQLIGVTVISEVYKHMIDNRTIQIKVKAKDKISQDFSMKLSFQPVSSFNRKNTASINSKRPEENYTRSPSPQKNKELFNQAQMSFSNKNMKEYFNETLGNNSNNSASFLQTSRIPVIEGSSLMKEGEGESLQSLAQQRQKILGQLFGKFKRQR